jgi:uncharacterized protein YciI
MFIVIVHYEKDLSIVDEYLQAHRDFLEQGFQKNYFLASGPQEPRTGGIILSQLRDKKILEDFLADDPFMQKGIAIYQIIAFTPVKYHQSIKDLI